MKRRSFQEAREFVHKLKLSNQPEWFEYCKSGNKPKDIPTTPDRVYKYEGWVDYGNWLGTGNIASRKKQFLPYEEARKYAHSLKLSGQEEWYDYCKSGNKPNDIPYDPRAAYKDKGWIDWGDFLGTGNISNRKKQFSSYEEARKYAHSLKLSSQEEWIEHCKSGKKPKNIPSNPNVIYENKGWSGYGNFLGTGNVAPQKKQFKLFEEARNYACSLKLSGKEEWVEHCKADKNPIDIPSNPREVYKNKGWNGWGNFLGTGNVATNKRKYRPYEEARNYAHSLKLSGQEEWVEHCKSGKKPKNIPYSPHRTYKGKGWNGYGDWLGTGNISNKDVSLQFALFEEARNYAHSLKLSGKEEWFEYCKSGNKPKNIPYSPSKTYKDKGWNGWGDFLGTGNIATQYVSEIKRKEFAKKIKSFNDSLDIMPQIAWYYILLQSGIIPTYKRMELLDAYKNGKISLDKLTNNINDLDNDDNYEDNINRDEIINNKSLKQFKQADIMDILNVLDNPCIASMDEVAIEAIRAELKLQIWNKIYKNPVVEIEKLKANLKNNKNKPIIPRGYINLD